MKVTQEKQSDYMYSLIGAKIIFTRHTERNKNSDSIKHNHVKFDKVYEVIGYSDYPEEGDGPQIICENGTIGDVPMDEMDYDIIELREKKKVFSPVTITLEELSEVNHMINALQQSYQFTHAGTIVKLRQIENESWH